MKKSASIFLAIFLLFRMGNSQTGTDRPAITGEMKTDLNNLLPEGTYMADIMDSIRQSPRYTELALRFQAAIKENSKWFMKYLTEVPNGEPLPYHKKFKMTKEEYEFLLNSYENSELISSGSEEIKIMKQGNLIQFKASGTLSRLNTVSIDLEKNQVIIGEQIVPYAGPINVENESKGFKSKWKGYSFNLEEPAGLTADDMKNLATLTVREYKFIIGRLEKNGKTFLQVKGTEVQNGLKTVSFSLPIVF